MRILRIALRNFRGVVECEVRFPTEGVTIVEGPNEIGKTSISEAIDLVLNERDDSTKRSVRAVKPVGRDVGAEVEIEVVTGPYHFVYRKCWHRQRATELRVLEPQRVQLTGREAHDRVREMLDETLDAALWEALRLRQGTQLEQAALAGGSLGRALDAAAGGDAAGDREDDLWVRITDERDRYWTATWQLKGERTALAAQVDEAAAAVSALEGSLRGLQDDADAVERLQRAAAVLTGTQRDQVTREAALAEQFAAIERRRTDIDRLRGAFETARAHRDRAREVANTRADLVSRQGTAAAAAHDLASAVHGAGPALAAAGARLSAAQEAVRAGRDQVRAAEAAHRRAVVDETYRRQQIELSQLTERRDRVHGAVGRRRDAEEVLARNRVDDEAVGRIQDAFVEVARAEAAAAAGASTVHTRALADLTVHVDGEAVPLAAGEGYDLVVADSTRIDVADVVEISVAAGTEARSAAERLEAARATLATLCSESGVEDLSGARVAAEERKEALRSLDSAERTMADDLRDLSVEALDHKTVSLGERVRAFEVERPTDPPLPADLDAAHDRAVACDGELGALRDRVARLESDEAEASRALQELRLDEAGAKANLDQARELEQRESGSLDAARRVASDDEVARGLGEAEAALQARADALARAEEELGAEHPDTVETRLGNTRDALKRLAAELHDNDTQVRALRTRLEVKGDEGLARQLDDATTALVHLSARRDGLEARAAAARRLYDAFATRRAEAHRRYVAPFREQIEGLARIVFGASVEIELDDELRISRRTLDGVTLDFADLSTGAREQLGMISRLAGATIVSADGGAPVIFDDALGWSDPAKLDAMGAVIRTAGQTCQIIILTCTPDRYSGVGRAEVVRLPV